MHPTDPRFMDDERRIDLALECLDTAYNALCWIGTGAAGIGVPNRPAKVSKAIVRIDKAMVALEREQGK